MRYRKLSPTGDYLFGAGQLNYLINTPETVAQAVQTTLLLWLGEWYLNVNDGTPYPEGVIGKHSKEQADQTIINQIRGVQGVIDIVNFQSTVDPETRKYTSVSGILNTIYGETKLEIENFRNF